MSRIADALQKAQEEVESPGLPDLRRHPAVEHGAGGAAAGLRIPWPIEAAEEGPTPSRGRAAGHGTAADSWRGSLPPISAADASERERRVRGVQPISFAPAIAQPVPVRLRKAAPARRSAAVTESDLSRCWHVVRERWLTGALVLLVVVSAATVGTVLQQPTYRATGLLEIRRESAGTVPVDTLFSSERVADDDLETQFGILKSATLAERVAAQLAPTGTIAPAAPGGLENRASTAPPIITSDRLRGSLGVNPKRGSRLVEVSFEAEDPALAVRVVNAVFDNYLQIRTEEAQRSVEWLEAQLGSAQRSLEQSERRMQAYIQEHGLEVLETGKGETAQEINERLRLLHESLAKAQAERIATQSQYEAATARASSRELESPVLQSLSLRVAELRQQRAKLASTFHDEYPALQAVQSEINQLESALDQESGLVLSRVQRDFQAARRREALLRQALDRQNAMVQALSADSAGYEALKRGIVTNQQLFASLDQKLKEVTVSAALKAANVGIVDRPKLPLESTGTPLLVNVSLSLVTGLILGIGLMFLREHFDSTVKTENDVHAYLGVPTLAAIPAVAPDVRALLPDAQHGVAGRWRIERDQQQQSPLTEAFAALRTAVLLDDDAPASRVLMITSAEPEEGKTTVSVNLALSLARLKNRVLLVDANLRHPCVQEALGLDDKPGLGGYLTSDIEWRQCVHAEHDAPTLHVLVGGGSAASPADLLALPRMREFVEEASQEYDFVVIDAPALLAHPADVRTLATLAQSVLLTVRYGSTSRDTVSLALSQLHRVTGVVLNRFDGREAAAHGREAVPRPAMA